ncbi:MAG: DUF4142 domain-containing protein [Bacteroidia bacterium]
MEQTKLRKNSLIIFILIALVYLPSCKRNKKVEAEKDPTEVAETKNEKMFDAKTDSVDAQFLVDATESNLMEIKMAQLVISRFSIYDVKDLASMLLADHTKLSEEMTNLALRKAIAIPTEVNKLKDADYKKLDVKQGKGFDNLYCDMMISNHQTYIRTFEKAAKECADIEIKEWAAKTLATFRDHLQFSKDCKMKLSKMEKIK